MSTFIRMALAALLLASLAACGAKGSLFLPDRPAEQEVPATDVEPAPAADPLPAAIDVPVDTAPASPPRPPAGAQR